MWLYTVTCSLGDPVRLVYPQVAPACDMGRQNLGQPAAMIEVAFKESC